MKKRIFASLTALAMIPLLYPISASAGAWTQEKDHGLVVLNATYYGTSHFYDFNGDLQPQRHFGKYELNGYGEYGIGETTTIGANVFFDRVEQAGVTNTTLSNTELFLRQRIYKDDSRVISIQPLIKLPTVSEHDRDPRGGSEDSAFELAVLYGENLNIFSKNDYADSLAALRYRTDGLAAQYRVEARVGMNVYDRIWVTPGVYYTQSLNPSISPFVQSGDLDYDLAKAELGIAYKFDGGDYIQLTGFDHFAGALTGSGKGFTVGYGMNF